MTSFTARALLLTLAILAAMLVSIELGGRLAARRRARAPGAPEEKVGAVEGAVFALFGLLLAFSFSGAASRFEERRALVTVEANAVGTAYLRLDLLPAETQPAVRALFRDYVQSRIAAYRKLADRDAAREEFERGAALQARIWRSAVDAARATGSPAVLTLVVSSLNEMFDVTTTRLALVRTHQPHGISALLLVLAVAAALVAGYSMEGGRRSWLHALVFAVVISATLYVILDLEYPRLGFIRVDRADQLLVEVLTGMR